MSRYATHAEIDEERQAYLANRLALGAHSESGIYPFGDVELTRPDVEWLLAARENPSDQVVACEEGERGYVGLDLRGARLQRVDLSGLPLAHLLGGRHWLVSPAGRQDESDVAGVHLEGADLGSAHLEGSFLGGAHLEECFLGGARLQGAYLEGTHLEGANLEGANLEGAQLVGAHLEGAQLVGAQLVGANLEGAHLEGANLAGCVLAGRTVPDDFLKRVRQWDRDVLTPANLQGAFFDAATVLEDAVLGDEHFGFVSLADLHWGAANLSVVEWDAVTMLGDERRARQTSWLFHYQAAVRAYRQLASQLRQQGLHEEAMRFAYRGHVLQRRVLWRRMLQLRRQGRAGRWRLARTSCSYLCSWASDLFAGYGYRPLRILVAYVLLIGAFMTLNYVQGLTLGPRVSWEGSFVESITVFGGLAYLATMAGHDVQHGLIGAIECLVGLVFEIGLVLVLARRFLSTA